MSSFRLVRLRSTFSMLTSIAYCKHDDFEHGTISSLITQSTFPRSSGRWYRYCNCCSLLACFCKCACELVCCSCCPIITCCLDSFRLSNFASIVVFHAYALVYISRLFSCILLLVDLILITNEVLQIQWRGLSTNVRCIYNWRSLFISLLWLHFVLSISCYGQLVALLLF